MRTAQRESACLLDERQKGDTTISRGKTDLGWALIEGAPDGWADSDGVEEGFEDGIVDIDGCSLGCVDSEGFCQTI